MDGLDLINTAFSLAIGALINHVVERLKRRREHVASIKDQIDHAHELAVSYWLDPQADSARSAGLLLQARLGDIEQACLEVGGEDKLARKLLALRKLLTGENFLGRDTKARSPLDPRFGLMDEARADLKSSLSAR